MKVIVQLKCLGKENIRRTLSCVSSGAQGRPR